MVKKYKIKIGQRTYYTIRKSSYILGLICKLILARRRISRFLKRNLKESKIALYMFFVLIAIYSIIFYVDIILKNIDIGNRKVYLDYLIFMWKQRDIFITSILIVMFLKIFTNETRHNKLLKERFTLCSSIQFYFNNLLSSLDYHENVDLKKINVKEILSKIPALNDNEIKYIVNENKNIIINIINKFYLIDEDEDKNESEMINVEVNCLYNPNISNIQKIEKIFNIYSCLFYRFYLIWNLDNHINSIVETIFLSNKII